MASKVDVKMCEKAIRVYMEAVHIFSGRKLNKKRRLDCRCWAKYYSEILANDTMGDGVRIGDPITHRLDTLIRFDREGIGRKYFWIWPAVKKRDFKKWEFYLVRQFRKSGLEFRPHTA